MSIPLDSPRWKASSRGSTPAAMLQDRYRRARADGESQLSKSELQGQALSHLEDAREEIRRLEALAKDDMANEGQVLRGIEKLSKSLVYSFDWMGEAHGSW